MDKIIFGDNQFFGINHMSEEKAQAQAERFKDTKAIVRVIDAAYECGIHAFMFNTHDRVAEICDHFRANPAKYSDLRLYPSMPYAHKYANAVNEKGIIGALNAFLFSGRTAGQALTTLLRGGRSIINQDMTEVMKLLVDAEMRMFRGLNVRAVFLQNIVTDLLLGLRAKPIFISFASHVQSTYGVDPAFNTMNMPRLVEFLLECGIENPIICSSINKAGYLMHPDRGSYEATIRTKPFRPLAMSILASGAISPDEAVAYVAGLGNIKSVVFGASSPTHILETKRLIEKYMSN
ncbi:hypothetical protein MUP00_08995 [Candidatus Bathyarchaeota archaeon]|nr:hypothetical protein [Candidatus Bathyarchaeota archaeon]